MRLLLKISLILWCAIANAEPKVTDTTIDSGFDSVIESTEEMPPKTPDVSEDDLMAEATAEQIQADNTFINEQPGLIKDVVLVLDNSGSMKKNDPNFLVNKAVKEFISQQDENTRVGIVIFDQGVRLSVPLTDASLTNRVVILSGIENINYKGLFTDSPAGVERAIYELKNNGRKEAQKSIIFMTDGIVDTGSPEKDLEKSKWLREDLAPDAKDNNIKIFGIAFTEGADFQLIQSISQKTGGEYYRALSVGDLQNVFKQIDKIINTPPEPKSVPVVKQPALVQATTPVVEQTPPAPVVIEVPVQSMGEEERVRSIIIITAIIVLTLVLLGILILLIRRNKELNAAGEELVPEAYINDLQGKTDKQTHKLDIKPTLFGRVVGKDTGHLNYIVVNESTIGRRHALIEFKNHSFWIIDQGSINGTFVNGEPVSNEVCLKHGDRIRLHKCEFEFIMPEMEDSGMTVISNTVFAEQSTAINGSEQATKFHEHNKIALGDSKDATEILDSNGENMEGSGGSDMNFDVTGAAAADELFDLYEAKSDEKDMAITDLPDPQNEMEPEPQFTLDEDDTIMLDDDTDPDNDETLV